MLKNESMEMYLETILRLSEHCKTIREVKLAAAMNLSKELYSKPTQCCGTNDHAKGNGGGDVMELKEFTVDDCLRTMYETPSDGAKSNEGKVCIIPLENLAEEYRRPEYQLFRVSGGFGCIPGGIGRACYGRFCIDGERTMWPKGDFLGVANERVERIAEEMEAAWKDRTVEKNMEM